MIFCSLITLGTIAGFDEIYFHQYKSQLLKRAESCIENYLHLFRSFIFSFIFIIISSFSLQGTWAIVVLILFLLDVFVSIGDILVERKSRSSIGGLSTGEYLTHMLLSFHLGMLYLNLIPKLIQSCSQGTTRLLESFGVLNLITLTIGILTFLYSVVQLFYLRKITWVKSSENRECVTIN